MAIVSEKLKIGRETLVHIMVHRAPGRGTARYELDYFPKRCEESAIYYSRKNARHQSPTKPRGVIWKADGLKGDQRLIISAKNGAPRALPQKSYTIEAGHNAVRSGPALRGPNKRKTGYAEISWRYNIALKEGRRVLAKIDPEIIIKEDP